MYETINEKIDCKAYFGTSFYDVTPDTFVWEDAEIKVKDVNYIHKLREGSKILHSFSCTDGNRMFELRFDASELKWYLNRISRPLATAS